MINFIANKIISNMVGDSNKAYIGRPLLTGYNILNNRP